MAPRAVRQPLLLTIRHGEVVTHVHDANLAAQHIESVSHGTSSRTAGNDHIAVVRHGLADTSELLTDLLSEALGTPFAGLQQAARSARQQGILGSKLANRLCRLGEAAAEVRHFSGSAMALVITSTKDAVTEAALRARSTSLPSTSACLGFETDSSGQREADLPIEMEGSTKYEVTSTDDYAVSDSGGEESKAESSLATDLGHDRGHHPRDFQKPAADMHMQLEQMRGAIGALMRCGDGRTGNIQLEQRFQQLEQQHMPPQQCVPHQQLEQHLPKQHHQQLAPGAEDAPSGVQDTSCSSTATAGGHEAAASELDLARQEVVRLTAAASEASSRMASGPLGLLAAELVVERTSLLSVLCATHPKGDLLRPMLLEMEAQGKLCRDVHECNVALAAAVARVREAEQLLLRLQGHPDCLEQTCALGDDDGRVS